MADPEAPDHPVAGARTPARIVGELSGAHIAARCLHVAAAFGVADVIGEEPADPQAIASGTAAALERAPRARGILFDLPHVVAEVASARTLGLAARTRAGDPSEYSIVEAATP